MLLQSQKATKKTKGIFTRLMEKQCFNYAELRNASCPVIKYLTFYLFIWLAELAFLAFLVGSYYCFFFFISPFFFWVGVIFFLFLKETRPPCRRSPLSTRQISQTSRGQPSRAQLALGCIRIFANSELISVDQDFSGKPGSLFPRAQLTLQRLY